MSGFHELELRRRLETTASGKELCARCAAKGNSCCKATPAESHLFFPLSEAEWSRLTPYAYLAVLPAEEMAQLPAGADMIREEEPNTEGFTESMERLFPDCKKQVRELFSPAGRHFRVRISRTGECVFLGEQGCRLPEPVRPWYCVLFPGWVTGRLVTWFVPDGCLIAQAAHSPAQLCSLLHTTPEAVRRMFDNLKSDWGLDVPDI